MDRKVQYIAPDYKRIYIDILKKEHPDKMENCRKLLTKKHFTMLDVIELNQKIFDIKDELTQQFNQKHKAYSKSDILKILEYQKENRLNNSQVARHFKLSRNSIGKWKRIFLI